MKRIKRAELSGLETAGVAVLVVVFLLTMIIVFVRNSVPVIKDQENITKEIVIVSEECAKNPSLCAVNVESTPDASST